MLPDGCCAVLRGRDRVTCCCVLCTARNGVNVHRCDMRLYSAVFEDGRGGTFLSDCSSEPATAICLNVVPTLTCGFSSLLRSARGMVN